MATTTVAEVRLRAQGALHSSPIFALRELRVDDDGDGLRITGTVGTFYHKQLAQEAVLAVARDQRVVNTVSVS
jgi:hypothetical protein